MASVPLYRVEKLSIWENNDIRIKVNTNGKNLESTAGLDI